MTIKGVIQCCIRLGSVLSVYGKDTHTFFDKCKVEKGGLVTEENRKNFVGAPGYATSGDTFFCPLGQIAGALIR